MEARRTTDPLLEGLPQHLPDFHDAYVRERDACAEGASVITAVAANQLSLHEVKVPVLLASGAEDAMFTEGSGEAQRDRFTGSDDVSLVVIPALGHSMFLERRAAELRAVVSAWLAQRGF